MRNVQKNGRISVNLKNARKKLSTTQKVIHNEKDGFYVEK